MQIDVLVRMIVYLLRVKDQPIDSLDDPSPPRCDGYFVADIQSLESHVRANELLRNLWKAVTRLPREHRDAFAFGFEDEAGQDLFTTLLAAGIVSWTELANGMGRSVQELVRLRMRMPMDTAGVAAELKASRENIYKWRFRAIQRLRTDLEDKTEFPKL